MPPIYDAKPLCRQLPVPDEKVAVVTAKEKLRDIFAHQFEGMLFQVKKPTK